MRFIRFLIVPVIYTPLLLFSIVAGGGYVSYLAIFIILSYFILDMISDEPGVQYSSKLSPLLDAALYLHVLQSLVVVFLLVWVASPNDIFHLSETLNGLTGLDLYQSKPRPIPELLSLAVLCGFVLSINMVVGHELTHRTMNRLDSAVGKLSLAIVGDSQFAISHIYCHHKNVATPEDAASARRGESIYRFIVRSTVGQYREAWGHERDRLCRTGARTLGFRNQLLIGVGITVAMAVAALFFGGTPALAAYLLVCLVSKLTYEATNYIQHYGLVRVPGERVRKSHSWDCRSAFSSSALLNLTRHSAHHESPNKKYWELNSGSEELLIQNGYIVQILRALLPFYWFRYMGKKLEVWDNTHATEGELELINGTRT